MSNFFENGGEFSGQSQTAPPKVPNSNGNSESFQQTTQSERNQQRINILKMRQKYRCKMNAPKHPDIVELERQVLKLISEENSELAGEDIVSERKAMIDKVAICIWLLIHSKSKSIASAGVF